MSVLDPKEDAAAFKPVIDAAVATLVTAVVQQFIPALQAALQNTLDGLTITVTVSKKGPS